jgi:succinate dehydrogenase / fumarate reductase cytochrome b subunit
MAESARVLDSGEVESEGPSPPSGDDAERRRRQSRCRLWRTMIGKKVVMAITGAVLVGFVIVHMVGNLKIFSGPEEINAYSWFLREVGSPGLSYEQLLWLVRIVLLVCVALHITAAIQLTRMSWAARPDGYTLKRDIEMIRCAEDALGWGAPCDFYRVSYSALRAWRGRVQPGSVQRLAGIRERGRRVLGMACRGLLHCGDGALCLHLDHGIWSMLQTPAARQAVFLANFRAVPVAVGEQLLVGQYENGT